MASPLDMGRERPAIPGDVELRDDEAALLRQWEDNLGAWVLPYLGEEIGLIENPYTRRAVLTLFQQGPRSWVERPSSTSGKYHPADERGPGGQVLHVRRVVRVVRELASAEGVSGRDLDRLTGAALVHDLCKFGVDDDPESGTVTGHEVMLERLYGTYDPRYGGGRYFNSEHIEAQTHDELNAVVGIAKHHSGRWGPAITYAPDTSGERWAYLGRLLHYADMIASRSWVTVNVGGDGQQPEGIELITRYLMEHAGLVNRDHINVARHTVALIEHLTHRVKELERHNKELKGRIDFLHDITT